MTVKLAAVVLAKDVANHIAACLETLRFADLVIVLSDPGPDDGTKEISRTGGARVVERAFDNFAGQRNAALDEATTAGAEWVFFVDADERVTPELAAEVRGVIGGGSGAGEGFAGSGGPSTSSTGSPTGSPAARDLGAARERTSGSSAGYLAEQRHAANGAAAGPECVGWWVPRHNYIAGQRVRYGGFYPDYQLRLLRSGRARYDPERPVHEVVLLDGPAGRLCNVMIHYNYDSWAQFHAKQRRYAAFEGRILRERGVRPWPHKFVTVPFREWRRRYLALQGYRDGWLGLKLACLLSYYYGFMPHWELLRGTKG